MSQPTGTSCRTISLLVAALLLLAPALAQQTSSRYTGEPISLNLKDVDLLDFFRLIHEVSGLNVVIDPAVRGTVTLVMSDVPWDQAFSVVVKNNGLVSELEGNVLRVMTRETARRELEAQKQLAQAMQAAVPLQTRIYRLSYGHAGDVAQILKRFLSPRGEIAIDARTNALIITDVPSVVERILGRSPAQQHEPPPR